MKRNINNLVKKLFLLIPVYFVVTLILVAPVFVHAVADNTTPGGSCPAGQLCNPIGSSSLADFLGRVADAALRIGVPIAAIFIIFAGFKFVTAAGNETDVKAAKQIFWYTIIGTAILLGARLLVEVLSTTATQVLGR